MRATVRRRINFYSRRRMFVSLGIASINRNDSKRSGCHERSKETFSMKTDRDHGNRRAPQREPPCTLVLIVWGEPGGTCSLFLSVHQTVIRRQTWGRRSRPSGAGIPRQGIDWSLTAEITYAWAARNKTQTRRNIILTFPLRASRSAGPAHVKREPRGSRTLPQRLKIRSRGKRHWKLTGASWKYHTAPINTMKRILRLPISLLFFLFELVSFFVAPSTLRWIMGSVADAYNFEKNFSLIRVDVFICGFIILCYFMAFLARKGQVGFYLPSL